MKPQDLRGAARLATEATAGLTDLVEAMHERIARVPGLAGALDGRTTGITGLVYRSIRGVTRVAGGTVDALLGLITPALSPDEPAAPPAPEREALVAALNGVLGDHLAATHNPLAITMALRIGGRALPLQREALAAQLQALAPAQAATPTLLVLLHGLCMNDLQWQRKGQDLGALLAPALGALPLYLHANTGLPITQNGLQFAALMQQLVEAWPVPVQRVVLLGHSMGGLIARSALHQAQGQAWAALCSDLVCLGSPHHGAPLERAGHGVDLLLGATPFTSRYTAPLARLGRIRSAGITDLRHGLRDAEGRAIPLPNPPLGPRCWALAGTLDAAADAPGPTPKKRAVAKALGKALGDGLVPLASALGQHADAAQTLAFAPERQAVLHGTGHLDLLSSPAAAQQLRAWLAPG
jgi:pimeloyl-ACP methyl ester carboxylesterase